ADLAEPAGVLVQLEPEVGDLAVTRTADGDLLELGASVAEVHHRLGARLAEPDRATGGPRQRAEQQFLGVAPDLGAEPAADVGSEDPHIFLLDAGGGGDRLDGTLGVLGRDPDEQPVALPGGG